jgi:taurine dioxygenase
VDTKLKFKRLEPFGVEVDIDLAADLDSDTKEELLQLMLREHLLCFTHQDLSFDKQVEVMTVFGPVKREPGDLNPRDYITTDEALGANSGAVQLAHHSDLAHSPVPFIALSLYGMTVDEGVTSTTFIDSVRVLEGLPADLQDRITDLDALHVLPTKDGPHREHLRSTGLGRRVDFRKPYAIHPLVLTHPRTDEPILYMNEMMTDRLIGLSDEDSEALIHEIYRYLYDPVNVLEWIWREGDFVIWDNLAVQHGRPEQSSVANRTLRRVVCAEMDLYEQHPQMAWTSRGAVLQA